jgi:hypothetical protein
LEVVPGQAVNVVIDIVNDGPDLQGVTAQDVVADGTAMATYSQFAATLDGAPLPPPGGDGKGNFTQSLPQFQHGSKYHLSYQAVYSETADNTGDCASLQAVPSEACVTYPVTDLNSGLPLFFRLASSPRSFVIETSPAKIVVAEDGDEDEVVQPCPTGNTCVPNQAIQFAPGSDPQRACVNDVNHDGLPDVCTFTSSGQFCESIAQGGNTYQTVCTSVGTGATDAIPFACSAGGGTCVAVAQSSPPQVQTFVAAADGTLTPQGSFPVDPGPAFLVTGDFNGDKIADIAVVNSKSDTVTVLLGDGAGNLTTAADIGVGLTPVAAAVGDVNGDGKADILVTNSGSNSVTVLLGDGTGQFTPSTIALSGPPAAIALGDLTLDGKLDFVVAYPSQNSVGLYVGDGTGGFAQSISFAPSANPPAAVAIGDLNGDGKPDLAIAYTGSNSLVILYNNMVPLTCKLTGASPTAPVSVTDVQAILNEALGIAAAVHDLNQDGTVNVVDVQYVAMAALGQGCPV